MSCFGGGGGGGGGATPTPEEKRKDAAIKKEMTKRTEKLKQEFKVLLLGPGESGKSTVFKQMKILSRVGGLRNEELEAHKFIVFGNCITQMKVLVNASFHLDIELELESNDARAERIANLPPRSECWSGQVGYDIQELWKDQGIRETFAQRHRFQLNDSAEYFFNHIARIADPAYLPTTDDVLRARVRSTGIDEAVLVFEDLAFRVLDVGGQRSERRKWIHCFDTVTAIIYVASLAGYDQVLREDQDQNRMLEALQLFDELCNLDWFRETTFILFLNKLDIFEEKIVKSPLGEYFPKYTGGSDVKKAKDFIRTQFTAKNRSPHDIFSHFTTAINTKNVDAVFQSVRTTVVKAMMGDIAL
eukprot:TRINITY_DN126_c0_g1_i1.p1 TRINITY_DN126_c0_g1~~TRINITY_DN126_c0_g1_i1.p1  ORF type:complete len:359 (-),score=104.05 TRINITY_DN126_c0_g1_i1:215-1291(-)